MKTQFLSSTRNYSLSYYQFITLLYFLTISYFSNAQNWVQGKKMVASDRTAFDNFGSSVAINEEYAIIGAAFADPDGAGAAYIFKKGINGNWTALKKIVASDQADNDFFGTSVAINGNYIVVGAMAEDHYVPSKNYFHHGAGAAYIFKKDQGGVDNWGQLKKIIADDGSSNAAFGIEVAISGDYVIAGATGEGYDAMGNNYLSSAGAAYIFKKDQGGVDNWGQLKKIVSTDREVSDRFGNSVAIHSNLAAVGAYWEDDDGNNANSKSNAGSAYVFKQDMGGVDNWGQLKKIIADDRASNDEFGISLSLNDQYLAIGADGRDESNGNSTDFSVGAVYIFTKDQGGSENYGQTQKLLATDKRPYDAFGKSLALYNNQLVIGARTNDTDESDDNHTGNAGAAYIFQVENENWLETQKIVAADRTIGDLFGQDVATNGETILVGANEDAEDAMGTNPLTRAGSAYIFSSSCATAPTFSGIVTSFCDQDNYQISIQVTDFGDANSVEILVDGLVEIANAQLNQTYILGPYQNPTIVKISDETDNFCTNSNSYNINCSPSQIVKLHNFSDPHPSSIDGFGPRFTNLVEGESLPNTYNYFGTNLYNNDVHLWEFDGCQFTEIYHQDYNLVSERIMDGKGNLIVYGNSKIEEASYLFKYDGQTLTRFDNPPNYAYSTQFHLANSSTNNNYFIYFTGVGIEQTYKIFYVDNNEILQEIANPTGYHPSVSLPSGTERGFSDNNGNVFILYQKIEDEFDRIWGVHDGTSLTLLNYPVGGAFSLDFKGIASNGDVLFAGPSTPIDANVYKYNQNGLALVVDAGINDPPVGIDSEILGTDGINDYFKLGDDGLVKYDGTTLTKITPPEGTGSHFLAVEENGNTLWGYTFINSAAHLFVYDGTNYEIRGKPDEYNLSSFLLESSGTHFFSFNKQDINFPGRLSTMGYYNGINTQIIENPVNSEQAQIIKMWKEETTGAVYVVFGNWGLFFNTNQQPNAYYQSNENYLYRFTLQNGLELLPMPTAYPWFEQYYSLNGKSFLLLKPAHDAEEMVVYTIENNRVVPLKEHFTISQIHTPNEADYMLASANNYQDMIKILPEECDNSPCADSLFVEGNPIRIGYFQAVKEIEISIVSEALCKAVAGETITLKPGFYAKSGSEFLAQIEVPIPTSTICPTRKRLAPITNPNPIIPTRNLESTNLTVFPNPFTDKTTIQFTLNEPSPLQLTLYNLNGQKVSTILQKNNYSTGQHQLELHADKLPVGVYFLTLQTVNERITKKLIIQQQ